MSNVQKIKLANFKPWAVRVLRKHLEKQCTRKQWTRTGWQQYADERDARREKKKRPKLMEYRLRQQAEERYSEACRQRMIALNAKRRAAKVSLQTERNSP